MIEERTLYDILGVEPNAPPEKIRAIYRLRTREAHPDRNHGNEEPQKQLNQAYEILSDPEKRREYNKLMGLPSNPRAIKSGKPTYQEISVSFQKAGEPIPYTFQRWEPCRRCWGVPCWRGMRMSEKGRREQLEEVGATVTLK